MMSNGGNFAQHSTSKITIVIMFGYLWIVRDINVLLLWAGTRDSRRLMRCSDPPTATPSTSLTSINLHQLFGQISTSLFDFLDGMVYLNI